MPYRTATLSPNERNPELLHLLFFAQQFCLLIVIQLAVISVLASFFAPAGHLVPEGLTRMRAPSALAALFSAISLFLSESEKSRWARGLSRLFATLAGLVAATYFLEPSFHVASKIDRLMKVGGTFTPWPRIPILAGVAYVLLSAVMILIRARGKVSSRVVDGLTSGLCLLVLTLLCDFFLGLLQVPGSSAHGLTSTPTTVCLTLLTLVALFRRSESGIFSLFLAYGMGSKIARWLTPVVLIVPFLREIGRAHLLNAPFVPQYYATAVMPSITTIVAFGGLILLASRINRMQGEIQALGLRDELTGLYNVRGFNLLAEQALRLARRARQSFCVLFVDLDGLKQINDRLGHDAGSEMIAEAGQVLSTTFRETDVIGRIGGDELVVAGQFDKETILWSIERLQQAVEDINAADGRRFKLSLSIGFAVNNGNPPETLKSMLTRADAAMYEVKRLKKAATATAGSIPTR